MKNIFKLIGIIALVAVIGFSFIACDNDNGDDSKKEDETPISSFAGTWNASGGRQIVFSGSTFNYKVNGTTRYSGTFSVSGSTITFNESSLGTASGNFSLSGNTLTLSNHTWDSSVNGTYTKDSGGNTNFDTTALNAVINDATIARDGVVKASADSEVPTGKKWVTESEWNAFDTVYKTAVETKTNPTSQSAVDTAKTNLQAAIITFNAAKKDGSATAIKLSGTITVKNNGQIVPYLVIQAHDSSWNAFNETIKVSSSGENTPWEITTKPLSNSVKISFDISGYDNDKYENPLFSGYNVNLDTSVYNTNVSNIIINLDYNFITVSGTFNLSFKGQPVPSITIDINRKSDNARLGFVNLVNAGNNTAWSMMIPSQDVDTDVVFGFAGFDGPMPYEYDQLFGLWNQDFGVKVKNQNKTGIVLNLIAISGTINVEYKGSTVPTVDITVFQQLDWNNDNGDYDWKWVASTRLSNPPANTQWTIVIPAFTRDTVININADGKDGSTDLFGGAVATRTVKNTSVSGIAINLITLSGTVSVTYKNNRVPIVGIGIHINNNDLEWIGGTALNNPASNSPWSVYIPAFTINTEITFSVDGRDEHENDLFWKKAEVTKTVKDTSISGITLNMGNITE